MRRAFTSAARDDESPESYVERYSNDDILFMKTERRHDLETNWLASHMAVWIDRAKSNSAEDSSGCRGGAGA